MNILIAVSIIALAGLIHASFQLSVSMATSLSGHALGRKLAARRTLRLLFSFVAGAFTMTLLCVSFASYAIGVFAPHSSLLWITLTASLMIVGLAVILFYYRKTEGTELWISRSFARFLRRRTAKASLAAEAFSLGLTSVVAELLFTIVPIITAACAIVALPPIWQIVGAAGYTLAASLGLLIVALLIGSGRQLSRIQRWREQNKYFLQFAAGLGLIILGFYIYVNTVSDLIIQVNAV